MEREDKDWRGAASQSWRLHGVLEKLMSNARI